MADSSVRAKPCQPWLGARMTVSVLGVSCRAGSRRIFRRLFEFCPCRAPFWSSTMSATPTISWPVWCRRAVSRPIQVFSGAEALEAVAREPPDLILLDLLLARHRRLRALRPAEAGPGDEPDPDRDGHGAARCAPPRRGRARRRQRLPDQAVHAPTALRDHRRGLRLARRAQQARHDRRDQLRHPQRADLPFRRPTTCWPTCSPTPP